ncbi:TetR/AcrR family transcriptional regulator [Lutibacter citreus]|uniref:TetR/AcrR family transcriptional regulator n=1 Tax=Lutibacter citreus TaxID=2138210 RepID=UPI001300B417|nr:TetR/AcrR family transcriptional regulator [Lutibacter citreus]
MKVGDKHIEEIVFEKTKDLLLKYGVKGWNMNDLSEACSMSKRTLYKIIGTKEDLLSEISKKGISANNARIEKYLESKQPFQTLLNNLSQHILEGFDDFALIHISAIRVEYPRIREMIDNIYIKNLRELSVSFFEKGINEGDIVDYAEATVIEKTLHALIEYHTLNCNNRIEFKKDMDEVLTLFFKGIMK